MRCISIATAVWMAAVASAQDAQLTGLRATLETLHSQAAAATVETRGATPELTVAKHQLRDWIEVQLGSLKDFTEERAFENQINESLKAAGFMAAGDDQNLLGSLGEVGLSTESGLLIVTTAVGILCQYDESAYGYKRVNDRWQRVFESEQNDYSPKKYAPQSIVSAYVWQAFRRGQEDEPTFVMTLGNEWGCASAWHPVYYRVWRIDMSGSRLLIDDSEFAWLRAESFLVGSIHQDTMFEDSPIDVLVEFTRSSIDGGVHNREAARHYLISRDEVRRVDPVALSPRDFVDEWLTRPWSESATWSAPALQQWYRRFHEADFVPGEFVSPTMHCQTPDLWQVAVRPYDAEKNYESQPEVFFLIRWRPPYHFTLVNISNKPWPRCRQEDGEADAWRTLFSTQEWRR
jgi:hypothetical protein